MIIIIHQVKVFVFFFSVCEQEPLEHTQGFRDQILCVLDDETVNFEHKENFYFVSTSNSMLLRFHLFWLVTRWIWHIYVKYLQMELIF